MSAVRDDCLRALSDEPGGREAWEHWLQAVNAGATADISFRLLTDEDP